jgi:polyisoprenoid-binding protein YceI
VNPGSSAVATDLKSNVHPVHAVGKGLSGFLEGELTPDGTPDLDKPHRARLEMPLQALKSGNRIEDMEMERRMDVRRYPNIVAKILKLEPLGDSRYTATADLTVRDTTKTVKAAVEVHVDGTKLVVETEHVFDMRDFGVDPPRILMLKMEPEVRVKAHIEAELDSAQVQ